MSDYHLVPTDTIRKHTFSVAMLLASRQVAVRQAREVIMAQPRIIVPWQGCQGIFFQTSSGKGGHADLQHIVH
jgi:hypothetical protein